MTSIHQEKGFTTMSSQTGGTGPMDSRHGRSIGKGRPPGVHMGMNVGTALGSAHNTVPGDSRNRPSKRPQGEDASSPWWGGTLGRSKYKQLTLQGMSIGLGRGRWGIQRMSIIQAEKVQIHGEPDGGYQATSPADTAQGDRQGRPSGVLVVTNVGTNPGRVLTSIRSVQGSESSGCSLGESAAPSVERGALGGTSTHSSRCGTGQCPLPCSLPPPQNPSPISPSCTTPFPPQAHSGQCGSPQAGPGYALPRKMLRIFRFDGPAPPAQQKQVSPSSSTSATL